MGDVDGGDFQLALQVLDLHPHRGAQFGIQIGQRLVHQEHLRLAHNGAGKRRALPLAARQSAGLAVQKTAQFHHIGGAADQAVMIGLGYTAHPQRKADVFIDRHIGVKRIALKHHGDIAVARIHLGHHFGADDHFTLGRCFQPGDHPHGGGLATTRRAKQNQKLLIMDIKRHVPHAGERAVAFDDVLKMDRRHDYPFTAPMVRPRDRCFWIRITRIRIGRNARKDTRAIAL